MDKDHTYEKPRASQTGFKRNTNHDPETIRAIMRMRGGTPSEPGELAKNDIWGQIKNYLFMVIRKPRSKNDHKAIKMVDL